MVNKVILIGNMTRDAETALGTEHDGDAAADRHELRLA
jgi:single-stranded DNA-binding protein